MRFSDIEDEIRNVLDIDEADLTEEQKALYPAYLDELGGQEADKVDSFSQLCRLEEERASAEEAEGKRLIRRAKTRRNNIGRLKEHYKYTLIENGLKKVQGKIYTISIRSTPVVVIDNEAVIPEEYWRIKEERSVDKVAIRDAIKAGQEIAGASMGESISLQVR